VALIGPERPENHRFVDYIMGQREIYHHFGRAGVISLNQFDGDHLKEALNRTVHSFGRLDVVVNLLGNQFFPQNQDLLEAASPFLHSRPKSRYLLVSYRPDLLMKLHEDLSEDDIQHQRHWVCKMAKTHLNKNLTVNRLELGVTEEYLLERFPSAPSIRHALDEIKMEIPDTKLVEPHEVAAWIMFLASPLSQALTGQSLQVDHGGLFR